MSIDPEFPREQVEKCASDQAGAPATVVNAQRLAGGASMETWSVDLRLGTVHEALVLRRDMASNMSGTALSRAQEFQLLRIAHRAGVLAPRPRWLCTASARAFFLMDRIEGESVGRRVVRLAQLATVRSVLAGQMGEQLALIHSIDPRDGLEFLAGPSGGPSPARAALASVRETIDRLGLDHPVWEFAWHWLHAHPPEPSGSVTVVHGDFRIGNLLVTPQGLTGVLDWEFSHLGDPLEDLAWPLVRDWRFENDALHVGGVGTVEALLEGYERRGGRKIDRSSLHWWEIFGNLRWSVFCHAQAQRHLSGQDRSVELASLGRKSLEIEWELLDLIRRTEGLK
jgi:aminoglycoside phosphotransferase (APT) family kinase protein